MLYPAVTANSTRGFIDRRSRRNQSGRCQNQYSDNDDQQRTYDNSRETQHGNPCNNNNSRKNDASFDALLGESLSCHHTPSPLRRSDRLSIHPRRGSFSSIQSQQHHKQHISTMHNDPHCCGGELLLENGLRVPDLHESSPSRSTYASSVNGVQDVQDHQDSELGYRIEHNFSNPNELDSDPSSSLEVIWERDASNGSATSPIRRKTRSIEAKAYASRKSRRRSGRKSSSGFLVQMYTIVMHVWSYVWSASGSVGGALGGMLSLTHLKEMASSLSSTSTKSYILQTKLTTAFVVLQVLALLIWFFVLRPYQE